MNSRRGTYASLVLVQVFFGLHYLAAKIVMLEVPPRAWALIRAGGAAVLLLIAVRVMGRRLPTTWPVLARLAFLSIFGIVINQVCFLEGLSRTSPTHSSIIVTTIPVGTLLFAVLLRREAFNGRRLAVFGVAFAGVLLVIRPLGGELSAEVVRGDVLTLINALSYSLFLVLSKRLLDRIDALGATAVLMTFGSIWMLVPAWPVLGEFDPSAVSMKAWALGLGIVVFPTAAAYLMIYQALGKFDSSIVAFFIYLQPLIATTLSVVLLGDRPEPSTLAGAALIFLAVYLALRGPGRRRGVG